MKKIIAILLVLFSGAYAADKPSEPKRKFPSLTLVMPPTARAIAAHGYTHEDQASLMKKMEEAIAKGQLLDPKTLTAGERAAHQAMLAKINAPKISNKPLSEKKDTKLTVNTETYTQKLDLPKLPNWNSADFPEDHEEKAANAYLAIIALAEATEANAEALKEAAKLALEVLNKNGD